MYVNRVDRIKIVIFKGFLISNVLMRGFFMYSSEKSMSHKYIRSDNKQWNRINAVFSFFPKIIKIFYFLI